MMRRHGERDEQLFDSPLLDSGCCDTCILQALIDDNMITTVASSLNHFDCFMKAVQRRYLVDARAVLLEAAKSGNIDFFKYGRERSPQWPISDRIPSLLAQNGHIDVLRYLDSVDYNWTELVCIESAQAAIHRHDAPLLRYMVAITLRKGYAISPPLLADAIQENEFDMLRWLLESCGSPLYEIAFINAVISNRLPILNYLMRRVEGGQAVVMLDNVFDIFDILNGPIGGLDGLEIQLEQVQEDDQEDEQDQIDIVIYMQNNLNNQPNQLNPELFVKCCGFAAEFGRSQILKWLFQINKIAFMELSDTMLFRAASCDRFLTFNLLLELGCLPTPLILNHLCHVPDTHHKLTTLQVLSSRLFTEQMATIASMHSNMLTLSYLIQNDCPYGPSIVDPDVLSAVIVFTPMQERLRSIIHTIIYASKNTRPIPSFIRNHISYRRFYENKKSCLSSALLSIPALRRLPPDLIHKIGTLAFILPP